MSSLPARHAEAIRLPHESCFAHHDDVGLVSTQPYKPVRLTAKGSSLANRCRERHEIVYQFLLAIGVDPQAAAIDAEGIEHHVSPETLKCFVRQTKAKQC